ncbi:GNAT family N-acetyltransferase [Alienimonas sp. DA493]|uniref:GNAT family N-acetyltransferase n=1 Tax=Alienimonas sp. DA493 TaxID=3373605 RepID=UPI00375517A1
MIDVVTAPGPVSRDVAAPAAGPIVVRPVRELVPTEAAAWDAAVDAAAVPTPYLSREFAQLVDRLRGGVHVALLHRGGDAPGSDAPTGFFPFQTDGRGIGRPVGGAMNDFHGLLAPDDLSVDLSALMAACQLRVWNFDHLLPHPAFAGCVERTDRSPYLDLSEGYDAYYKARRAAGSRKVKQIARLDRKFDRERGPLTFEPHVTDVAVLDELIRWKRAQYAATGVFDMFTLGWPRELLVELLTADSPRLTGRFAVLFRDGEPVAGDLGMRCGRVLHSWYCAYDDAHAGYGPGHICTLRTAEAAVADGVTRMELGKGPEEYKQSLASDALPIGEGAIDVRALAPLARGWRRTLRSAKATVANGPAAEPLRRAVRRVKRLAAAGGF